MKRGLLVMHYGTPATLDEVLPYYTHIRRGRAPSADQLDNLVNRYQAIGGPSPLAGISEKQGREIVRGLSELGIEAQLYVGAKHASPFVGDAVRQMGADQVEEAVALVLAPHYSSFSVAAYRHYAEAALAESGAPMRLAFIERWGALPELVEALASRLRHAMERLNPDETLVIFSAHSLPEKIMAAGDPYVEELLGTSRLVAESAGIPHWKFAFQSASDTGEPWLGPDILDVIEGSANEYKNIVACTVGFVSDHLEVLYDLGIEARDACDKLGLEFRRVDTIGVDQSVMLGLAREAAHLYSNTE